MNGFPNLFIIGAMKAGTSSLHEYLHQHPQIFMSRFKEPQYFAPHRLRTGELWGQGNPYPKPGIAWYLKLFEEAGNVSYAGESSVSYTARPTIQHCEQRIHQFNPNAKLIFLVRDPVERAISHYWHFVKDGREDLRMLPAMKRRSDYIARSDYAMQLVPYLNVFGRERIYILSFEDMLADPGSAFSALFNWLGVDSTIQIDTGVKYNVGEEHLIQTRRRLTSVDALLKTWRASRVYDGLPPAARALTKRLLYRPVYRNKVSSAEAISFLQNALRPRLGTFFRLVESEFPKWHAFWGTEVSVPMGQHCSHTKQVNRQK